MGLVGNASTERRGWLHLGPVGHAGTAVAHPTRGVVLKDDIVGRVVSSTSSLLRRLLQANGATAEDDGQQEDAEDDPEEKGKHCALCSGGKGWGDVTLNQFG